MDSTTDTPIILTEEFAAQAAQGIAAAVRSVYGLSPAEDQEYGRWLAHMERYLKERAQLPADPWAEPGLARAVERGVTDGARPLSFATRQEVALMVAAASKR